MTMQIVKLWVFLFSAKPALKVFTQSTEVQKYTKTQKATHSSGIFPLADGV